MSLPEFHTQHVFIIDEDERSHLLFRDIIGEVPHLVHVSTANNADEGIRALKELPELPDLLFLDLEMLSKDGLECLREIKNDKHLSALPVLTLSQSAYPSVINGAYEAGAHLHILISDLVDLRTAVHHVLSIDWKEKITQPPREEFVLSF